ncbi:MAG: hypothetical protein M3R27_16850, partial [Bacteroidota bacterium]|nr:hypothetical protein [Bacteroidota bacterium]
MKKIYSLCLLALTLVSSSSISQTVYTFTNAGAAGMNGPLQTAVDAAYASTTLASSVTVVSGGIQQWTVPVTGIYTIEGYGAQGGNAPSNNLTGGNGAYLKGTFTLTAGTVLNVVVGQIGADAGSGSSGGGGSFVYSGAIGGTGLLIAAGGGGGGGHDIANGGAGSATTTPISGTGRGDGGFQGIGLGGNGGSIVGGLNDYWNSPAAGGAGWGSDGLAGNDMSDNNFWGLPGTRFTGGYHNFNSPQYPGGFGGGGGCGGWGYSGGGGGGYTGGGGGNNWDQNSGPCSCGHGAGQGGGSFNGGSDQINTSGVRTGNGEVVITSIYGGVISVNSPISCFGGSNGALSVMVFGGTAPYSYSWAPTAGSGTSISGLSTGTYT